MALHHEQTKIVERIIASLEQGVLPWRKQFVLSASRRGLPYNAVSGKAYTGLNVLQLLMRGYPIDGGWMTYKQAIACGGNVRKGERSTVIFYYQKLLDKKRTDEQGKPVHYMLCKSYLVFHLSQCDNINSDKLHRFPFVAAPIVIDRRNIEADRFVAATGAIIAIGDKPCYVPAIDQILMPEIGEHETPDAYYSTLFHELTHWTGPRLGRNQSTSRNSKVYGYEELIAELCACFTLPQFAMNNESNSVSYLNSWIKMLTETPAILVSAASAASTANMFLSAFSEGAGEDADESEVELAA